MKGHKRLSMILVLSTVTSTVIPSYATHIQGRGSDLNALTIAATPTIKTTTSGGIEITTPPAIEIGEQKVVNSSFEDVVENDKTSVWKGNVIPASWDAMSYGSKYKMPDIGLDRMEKHNGVYSVKFEAMSNNDRGAIHQIIDIEPSTTYEISFYAKIENLREYQHFGMQVYEILPNGNLVTTDALTTLKTELVGTEDWKKYTYIFQTGKRTDKIKIRFAMGPSWKAPKGSKAWIDDISLKEVTTSVAGIKLSDEKVEGVVGGTYQLFAHVEPSYAVNKEVIWASGATEIVTVDETGKLSFVKQGETYVTGTTKEGDFVATCQVVVKEMPVISAIHLPEKMVLMVGESSQVTPVIVPNIAGVPYKWSTSNEAIMTVDEQGRVEALTEGKATLTVSLGEVKDQCQVEVIPYKTNKVPNGDFETADGQLPASYQVDAGTANVLLDETEAYTGSRSIKIEATEPTRVVIGNKDWIRAKDGIYGVSLNMKSLDATGKIIVDIQQDKTDNLCLTERMEYLVPTTPEGWVQLNKLFDGINVLRKVDFNIIFEGQGTLWLDGLKFYEAVTIQSIDMPDQVIELSTVDYNHLPSAHYTYTPAQPHDTRLVWQSSDSTVLEVKKDGTLIPKKAGEVTLTVFTQDHSVRKDATITVVGEPNVATMVRASQMEMIGTRTLEEGAGGKLDVEVAPANYTHLELEWGTSNADVVEVYANGRLHAKAPGTATITATDVYTGITATKEVTVTPKEEDKFDQVRQQWNEKIRKRYTTEAYDEMVDMYWKSMNTDEKRLYLWEDLTTDYRLGVKLGDQVTKRLITMATATTLPDSKYYNHGELQADLAEAIVWINETYLGKEHESYRKSWHWNIGIPKDLADLHMLLWDYLDENEIKEGMEFVAYEATPEDIEDFSAANLVDAAKSRIAAHILFKNEAEVTRYVEMALGALNLVDHGSGFYEDGSFIEHGTIAYTGSYGTVLLNGLGDMMDIFGGTSFDIGNNPRMINLYKRLEESYIPLISHGSFMDNTRGRAISRPGHGDHGEGHVVVSALIKVGYVAPEPYRTRLLSQAKRIVLEDKEHYDTMVNFYVKPNVDKLMADDKIEPAKAYIYSHEFGAMNRTVHHTEDFGLGISKSSKRIWTFEHLNQENKKGWNTGYGMTTLYNNDISQYQEGYWATIDPYRLPGTTADTGKRQSSHAQYGDGEGAPSNKWVGGVNLNNTFGTSGMSLKTLRKGGSTLTANKSWFMFDHEVVALGSNINSTDNRRAETIVENRKIDLAATNQLTINQDVFAGSLGKEEVVENVSWAHLEGRADGDDIGYYFPETQNLLVKKETRTGNYKEINGTRNEEHTNSFVTMVIDHGVAPVNQKYAYAIVPGATKEKMVDYTANPSFQVVANEETLHAVRHLEHNILAANFYENAPQQVEYIRTDGEAAIMVKENADTLEIAIADPTMEREQVVVDLLGENYIDIVACDNGVEVSKTEEGIRLVVATKDSLSKSFGVTLQTKEIVQEQVTKPVASVGTGTYTELQKVTLSTQTKDATIYYMLNTQEDLSIDNLEKATLYEEPLMINKDSKLQVIALAERKKASEVAIYDYIIKEVPQVERYTMVARASKGGKITPEGEWTVEKGDKVTFNITPDSGYVVKDVKVNGTSVGVVQNYSVEDVQEDISIEVLFVQKDTSTENDTNDDTNDSSGDNTSSSSHTNTSDEKQLEKEKLQQEVTKRIETINDAWEKVAIDEKTEKYIAKKHWAYETIGKMATLGVIDLESGVQIDIKRPITRSEMVQVMGRLLKIEPTQGSVVYTDINTKEEYANYLEGLHILGIVIGTDEGKFAPEEVLTREQMTSILVRFIESMTGEEIQVTKVLPFRDKDFSSWATESIEKAYSIGLVYGVREESFIPQKELSLAEALVMLERTMNHMN